MRVWVTREESSDGPLCTALRSCGLKAVLEPVLTRNVVDDCAEVIAHLAPDDWLVLTSPYAIESVAAKPSVIPKVAVVAESSRRLAIEKGLRVELVSEDGTGKSLFDELRRTVNTGKVCYPRSALIAGPHAWDGVELLSPVLYETVECEFDRSVVDRVDVVSVASPSAVRAVGKISLPFASIGPTTSAALHEIGVEPWVEAPQRSMASLANAIADQTGSS